MVAALISILVIALVAYVAYWIVTLLPLPVIAKQIAGAVIALIALVMILEKFLVG